LSNVTGAGQLSSLRHCGSGAIRFAVEDFPAIHTLRAWMRVGDERFNSEDIQPVRQQRLPTAPSHAEAGLKSSRILDLSAFDVAMTATLSAYRNDFVFATFLKIGGAVR